MTSTIEAPSQNIDIVGASKLLTPFEGVSPHTIDHMQRVGQIAGRLMDLLEAGPEAAYHAQVAGSLHDVGKLPYAELINAPRGLTDDERAAVAAHAPEGAELIKSLLPYNHSPRARRALEIASRVAALHHDTQAEVESLESSRSTQYIGAITHVVQIADQTEAMTDINRRYHRGKIAPWSEIRTRVLEQTSSAPLYGKKPSEVLKLIENNDLLGIHGQESQE